MTSQMLVAGLVSALHDGYHVERALLHDGSAIAANDLILRHINLTTQWHGDHCASFFISGQEYT